MSESLKIAYFVATKQENSFLGGLLITDASGIPLDFRYTEPITPTKLQSVLYGKALEGHLKEEVIQKTLLKDLKQSVDLFILPGSDLPTQSSSELKCPVLSLQKSQESPLPKIGESFRVNPREALLQVVEGASPLRVIFGSEVDLASQEGALHKLLEAGYQMDLLEPLERVQTALRTLLQPE